jgi:hypothetical protein
LQPTLIACLPNSMPTLIGVGDYRMALTNLGGGHF